MKMRRLGNTGLFVSTIGLGTLTWGRDTNIGEAEEQMRLFTSAGGNLIDTAFSYGQGESENVLGELFTGGFRRQDYIICTKAGVRSNQKQQMIVDNSRWHLLQTLDQSLNKLGTDYVDIWYLQHFDPYVRTTEVISTLEYVLRSGRARYVGLSNFPAWAIAEYAVEMRHLGYEVTAAQTEFSLLNRSVEGEILPAVEHFGIGFIASSPLGRGVLTGKYRGTIPPDSRAAAPHLQNFVKPYLDPAYHGIVNAVVKTAEGLDRDPAQVALSWAMDAPGVSAVLAGARNAKQLSIILEAADLPVPHQIRAALNDIS